MTITLFQTSKSQEINTDSETPYIKVIGAAEQTIIPDEIYLTITIRERESGRDKISIIEQEGSLKNSLIKLSIPTENLTIADAKADYIRIKWTKRAVISQREYELKLGTAKQVSQVLEKLDSLKIENVDISKVSHSKILEYRKEVRIMAIKAGKEKADYLLNAIGHKTGKALLVEEVTVNSENDLQALNTRRAGNQSYGAYIDGVGKISTVIEFRKIKLKSIIYLKFEIE